MDEFRAKAMGNFVALNRGEYDDLIQARSFLELILESADKYGYPDKGVVEAVRRYFYGMDAVEEGSKDA